MNSDPQCYPSEPDDERPALLRSWAIVGGVLLVAVVLIRSWSTLVSAHPGFNMEDALLFSLFYGQAQPLADIARSHYGQTYITLVSNGFAWLYAGADVRLLPYLYQWTGFGFCVMASCCLFFSGLIRSRAILVMGPLLLGLTAINHIYYYNTLIYVMYTAVILLLSLMIIVVRARTGLAVLLLPLLALFPWAGPYSVLAIPAGLALLALFRMPNVNRFALVVAIISTGAYFATVQGGTAQPLTFTKLGVIIYYLRTLLVQVVLLDQVARASLWWWLAVGGVVLVSFFLFRSDRYFIRISVVCFGLIAASLALFYMSIKFPLYRFPLSCHLVISQFFWCFFLLYGVDRWLVARSGGKWPAPIIVILLLVLIGADTLRFPGKRWVELPPGTEPFLRDLAAIEQLPLTANNQFVIMRLENPDAPFFQPTAIVGSREPDARRLDAVDLPVGKRSAFIVPP